MYNARKTSHVLLILPLLTIALVIQTGNSLVAVETKDISEQLSAVRLTHPSPDALRAAVEQAMAQAQQHREAGEWVVAYHLAVKARRAEAVLLYMNHKPVGAAALVAEYQATLIGEHGYKLVAIIAEPSIPESDRYELAAAAQVLLHLHASAQSLTDSVSESVAPITQRIEELRQAISERPNDEQAKGDMLVLYKQLFDAFLDAGHPDRAWEALSEGVKQEHAWGRTATGGPHANQLNYEMETFLGVKILHELLDEDQESRMFWAIVTSPHVSTESKQEFLNELKGVIPRRRSSEVDTPRQK